MADEIATLVAALLSDDFSQRLRSDASASVLRVGFQKLYSILRQSVRPVDFDCGGDGGSKLGLEVWDQTQIHALARVSIAVVKAIRSLSVEQVEPVVVAVVQQSIEFALCYLEKWIGKSDDSSVQNTLLQLLELLLVDGVHKELDVSLSCPSSVPVDLLPTSADKDDAVLWLANVMCMLRGSICSLEKEAENDLFIPFISDFIQVDIVTPVGQCLPSNVNKWITISQHWAVIHFRCNHRLISLCKEVVELPVSSDEKQTISNLPKKLSTCLRILKLLGSVARTHPMIYPDDLLLRSASSFIDILPILFRTGLEFVNNNTVAESSCESPAVQILEEFLQVMQATFCKNFVFQNIQACVAASILQNLGHDVWRFDKSLPSHKPPLAYFPRVVIFVLKLISDIKDQSHQFIELDDLNKRLTDSELDTPSCHVGSEKLLLLKKYSVLDLFGMLFPSSAQWLDDMMQLLFFLNSEGTKLKPILERSCSSGTKASVTCEVESVVCHEDEALFGDLFSEGGCSVGSTDVCEKSNVMPSSVSSISNMPFQAATELLNFLKTCVFSPQSHPPMYQDMGKKLNGNHIDILLSILNFQGYNPEERTCDHNLSLHEEKKFGTVQLYCFELLQKLVLLRAFPESLEESVVDKILIVENEAHLYNDLMLALLAHMLVCRVGSAGSRLRTRLFQSFIKFINEKAKTICSMRSELKDIVETLPSLFHIEIILMAFHLSSDEEKGVLANQLLSSFKDIDVPSMTSDSMQLSCWALLISRLVLVLRHMIYHPRDCPSLLLLDFRTKLRGYSKLSTPDSTNYLSCWPVTALEDVMNSNATLANITLLNQLIDIAPIPVSLCRDFPAVDCLGLNWKDVVSTFSQIHRHWNGKRAACSDDLILERYLFVLCWDIPTEGSSLKQWQVSFSGLKVSDILDMKNFHYTSHCILGISVSNNDYSGTPGLLLSLLQQMHGSLMRNDVEELGWDFFRTGSWLSFVLSLLCSGTKGRNNGNSDQLGRAGLPDSTGMDAEFLGLAKELVYNSFTADQVAVLFKVLSSLLKRYLCIYQWALASMFENGQRLHSADKFFPLLLLEHADLDKSMQDEFPKKWESNHAFLALFMSFRRG